MPPYWRTYQLMRVFPGLTPQAIHDGSAVMWDWLLKIHDTVTEAEKQRGQ